MKKSAFITALSLAIVLGACTPITPTPIQNSENQITWVQFDLNKKNNLPISFPFLIRMPKETSFDYDTLINTVSLFYVDPRFTEKDVSENSTDQFADVLIAFAKAKTSEDVYKLDCDVSLDPRTVTFQATGKSGKKYEVLKYSNCGEYKTLYVMPNINDGTYLFSVVNQKGKLGEKIIDEAIRSMTVLDN